MSTISIALDDAVSLGLQCGRALGPMPVLWRIDATSMLRVTVDESGAPSEVRVAEQWKQVLHPAALGRALVEGFTRGHADQMKGVLAAMVGLPGERVECGELVQSAAHTRAAAVARSRDEHRAAIIEALDHADEVRQAFAALMQATRRLVDTDFTNPGSSLVRAHVNGALQLTAVNFGGGFGYSASPKNIEHAATKALMDAYAVATQARQATIRDSALGEYHECIAERPRLRHAWDNRTDEELSRAIADEARACLQFVDAAMNAAGEAIVTTAGAAGDPELVSSAQVQQSKMDNLWMQARQALAAGADELTDLERCRDNGSPAILSEAEREAIDTWNVDLVRTLTSLAAGIGIACVHASSPVSTGEACASIAYACVAALAYAVACENAYCAATVAIASERYTTVVEHFGPPTA